MKVGEESRRRKTQHWMGFEPKAYWFVGPHCILNVSTKKLPLKQSCLIVKK